MADTKRKNRFGNGNGSDIAAAIRQNTEAQSRAALRNGTLPVWKSSSSSKSGASTTTGNAADAQKPVAKPISEPVPQKKKENISFWEKLLSAFGDAGYSSDTSAPLGMMNQAISDDYRSSGMQESKTAEAGGNIAKSALKGAESAYESAVGAMMSKRSGTQIMGVTVADDAVSEADKATAEATRQRNQANMYAKAEAADTCLLYTSPSPRD